MLDLEQVFIEFRVTDQEGFSMFAEPSSPLSCLMLGMRVNQRLYCSGASYPACDKEVSTSNSSSGQGD